MKKNTNYLGPNRVITLSVLYGYIAGIILSPHTALSAVATSSGGTIDCPSFCAQFGSNKQSPSNLAQNGTWSTTDDQVCYDLGQPTNTGTALNSGSVANPSASTCSGNIVVTQNVTQVLTQSGTSSANYCTAAGNLATHCQYHNSMVEKYCMAYNALSGGGGTTSAVAAESLLMALDFATAATCGVACLTENPFSITACNLASMGEGTAETAATVGMQYSPLAQYLSASQALASQDASGSSGLQGQDYASAALGGTGAALGAAGFALGRGSSAKSQSMPAGYDSSSQALQKAQSDFDTKNQELTKTQTALKEANETKQQLLDNLSKSRGNAQTTIQRELKRVNDNITSLSSTEKAEESAVQSAQTNLDEAQKAHDPKLAQANKVKETNEANSQAQQSSKKKQRLAACASSAVFATLGGLRAANLQHALSAKATVCQDVKNLTGSGTATSSSGTSSTSSTTTSSGVSTTSSTSTSGTLSAEDTAALQQAQSCFTAQQTQNDANYISTCFNQLAGLTSAATAEQGVTSPQGLSAVSPALGNLAGIASTAAQQGAGAAMSGMTSGNLGSLGGALSQLADSAQRDSAQISGLFGMQTTSAATYTGGGGSITGSRGSDPFAGMMAGFGTPAGGGFMNRAPNSLNFGSNFMNTDIWHSSSTNNLFQIVSTRIEKAANRIK